jgi:histidyl-tRNA synthetase
MENNKVMPKTLPGFMELNPNEQVKFNQMLDTIKKSYERFGFLPLDTPIIEFAEVLLAKGGGETEKQIYYVSNGKNNPDATKEELAMRFDHTVPLAKFVAANHNNLAFPFKVFQIGKVYRGERAQKGRYREFIQCDIDIIGDGELSIMNDAQIPAVIYNTFKELGFDNFTTCISNRKLLNGLISSLNLVDLSVDILHVIDKIDKIGREAVESELEVITSGNKNAIDTIMKFVLIEGTVDEKLSAARNLKIDNEIFAEGLKEIEDVVQGIRFLGVPDKYFMVDFRITRGLDYYTGTVYETFLNEYRRLGSLCGGGRYDNLAEYYTDKKLPGVGISIGLTRLYYQLNQANLIKEAEETISKVLVIPMDNDIEISSKIASTLRNAGINTDIYLETSDKMKKKMKFADKWKIPYVIIVGEEERESGLYTLKDMKTGEQKKLSVEDIIDQI